MRDLADNRFWSTFGAMSTWKAAVAVMALIVAYVLLAYDGRHHWHEFRYLYSSAFYSTAELMQGAFDPGPAPVRSPEEVAAWYVTELFHIYILGQLVLSFGLGTTAYTLSTIVYAIMLLASGALVLKAFHDLGMSPARGALVASVFVMSPLTVYLGFKLMAEVPALLFSACAVVLLTSAVGRSHARLGFGLSAAAGLFVALAALSSARMPLLYFGFWAALILVWAPARLKKSIVVAGVISWIAAAVAAFAIFRLLGGRIDIYYYALTGFFAFSKPFPMWMFALFNLGLFGMGLWLCVPLAWLSPDRRYRRFLLVWLLVSGVPVLLGTTNFMEPRYLATALVPFAGLAALGLEVLWLQLRHQQSHVWRAVTAGFVGIVGFAGTAAAQGFMPHEIDTKQLIQAVGQAWRADAAPILVPWNYSDFHFLRFAFPDRPIYLVQSAATESGELVDDPVWTSRFVHMYGDRFLPDAAAAPAGFFERRPLYVGWTVLPSLQNLHAVLDALGLARLATYVEPSQFRNHMVESWLVHDPRFGLRELNRYGQYQVYEVTIASPNVTNNGSDAGRKRYGDEKSN